MGLTPCSDLIEELLFTESARSCWLIDMHRNAKRNHQHVGVNDLVHAAISEETQRHVPTTYPFCKLMLHSAIVEHPLAWPQGLVSFLPGGSWIEWWNLGQVLPKNLSYSEWRANLLTTRPAPRSEKNGSILFPCVCGQGSAESASWRSFSGSAAAPQMFSLWIFNANAEPVQITDQHQGGLVACRWSFFWLPSDCLAKSFQGWSAQISLFYDEKRIALFLFGTLLFFFCYCPFSLYFSMSSPPSSWNLPKCHLDTCAGLFQTSAHLSKECVRQVPRRDKKRIRSYLCYSRSAWSLSWIGLKVLELCSLYAAKEFRTFRCFC